MSTDIDTDIYLSSGETRRRRRRVAHTVKSYRATSNGDEMVDIAQMNCVNHDDDDKDLWDDDDDGGCGEEFRLRLNGGRRALAVPSASPRAVHISFQ